MLFQPSNIYPSTFSGIGAGTVDVTQGINVSWQVNGDTPMTAYQIKIYQNDSGSTLMYDSGSVSVSPVFEPHDKNGNATYFTAIISAAALSTAGIVNGYQYGYKMLITQRWGVSDYVEQTSASVFITRSTPTLAINTITTPVASNSLTITANYSQAQGDPISTVEWVFALAGSESTPIRETGAISTQVLSFDADGLITGNTYSIMCKVVTSTGMEASTGFVQFPVSYSSSSLGINYQLAQLKNSSAVYLSWDDLGSNKLAYPYTDTTKTTNGITFTVNGEGDVVATGTASADAYFTIAQGTLSQLGITAGQKFIVTSGYSGAKIVVTETNSSNVVVSTITGNDPLQYIATSTTNTLKFSIVIPSGSVLSSGQQLKPMIALEDKIVAFNDVSANIEPIQDLHGYDHPWPAGGGINKAKLVYKTVSAAAGYRNLQDNSVTVFSSNTSAGYRYAQFALFDAEGYAGQTLTFTAKAQQVTGSSNPRILGRLYDSNGSSVGSAIFEKTGTSINHTFTLPATIDSGVTFRVSLYCNSGYAEATETNYYDIQVEVGSTAHDFAPYENICPITGRTGLSVYGTGKNLFEVNSAIAGTTNGCTISVASDGTITVSGTPSAKVSKAIHPSAFSGIGNLVMSMSGVPSGIRIYCIRVGDSTSYPTLSNGSILETDTYAYSTFVLEVSTTYNGTATDIRVQVEKGSTATAYETYQGNTYAVDWTTEAGTVYGGTLDVVTGVLTVDWIYKEFNGTEGWLAGSNYIGLNNAVDYASKDNNDTTQISNIFVGAGAYYANYNSFRVQTNKAVVVGNKNEDGTVGRWADATAFKSFLAGLYSAGTPFAVCYELATPLTYQLTPTQVEALVGTNNVWSTGDSVSVTYTKDTGSQATLSGAIVTFSDSNAVLIPTPQYIPGITGISIYRYLQGESALQHVYDLATGATSILDYYAPSQMQVSYLIVAHSGIGDLFLQTTKFTPTFWFFSILLCDTDSNGDYHVSKEYIFKYGVETGAVSNNNDPTIQKNFTPYPNRQPISSLYKTGKLTSYIGKTNSQNQYSDSVSLQNAIYDISTSPLTKFLKTRKGDILMIDTAAAIQMKTEDATTQQALRATVDWVEVGDASNKSIVSVPTDSFWPISANL